MGFMAISLGDASVVVASAAAWIGGGGGGGAAGVHKELKRQRVSGVRHTFWDLWMISTDVVFEHTTPRTHRQNHLQSLLILFLYGLLIPASLRMEGGHLIFVASSSSKRDVAQPPGGQSQPPLYACLPP